MDHTQSVRPRLFRRTPYPIPPQASYFSSAAFPLSPFRRATLPRCIELGPPKSLEGLQTKPTSVKVEETSHSFTPTRETRTLSLSRLFSNGLGDSVNDDTHPRPGCGTFWVSRQEISSLGDVENHVSCVGSSPCAAPSCPGTGGGDDDGS